MGYFYVGDKEISRFAPLWKRSKFGYAGSKVVQEAWTSAIEEMAEEAANLFLAANPIGRRAERGLTQLQVIPP